jgi:hypothetical protein
MSETQHTPGPWLVRETDTSVKVRTEHESICIMSIKPYSGRIEEGRANARLVAAAPDMLAALQDARVERDRLREALTFYANSEIYKSHPHGLAFDDRDLSYVARAALLTKEVGE